MSRLSDAAPLALSLVLVDNINYGFGGAVNGSLYAQEYRWDERYAIEEAEAELTAAFKMGRPGRYQIEAAIQSVHVERAHTGRTDSAAIAAFYDQLMQLAPSIGGALARAAARAEVRGPEAGLTLLDHVDSEAVISYQPALHKKSSHSHQALAWCLT